MARRKYLAIFEKLRNGYSAFCPDLPGLVVAGDTLEETERLIDEGIEIFISEYESEGLEVPDPSSQAAKVESL